MTDATPQGSHRGAAAWPTAAAEGAMIMRTSSALDLVRAYRGKERPESTEARRIYELNNGQFALLVGVGTPGLVDLTTHNTCPCKKKVPA